MPSSDLTQDVPKPLAMFESGTVHPDNLTILEDSQDARRLTPQMVKQHRRALKKLRRELKESHYEGIRATLAQLNQAYHDQKLAFFELKTRYQVATEPDECTALFRAGHQARRELARLEREYHELMDSSRGVRRLAARAHRMESRLREHRAALANDKLEAQLAAGMAKEAEYFRQLIVRRWAQLGYCYRYTVHRGRRTRTQVNYVQIEKILALPDELQMKIDVASIGLLDVTHNHLPNGVRGADLVSEETLNELTMACQRPVTSPHVDERYGFGNGLWLVVHRNGLTDGILNYITLETVLERYKMDDHPHMPLPLGVKRGRVINWINLAEHPHIMINGQSGTGKSNTINVILATLIRQHTPDELRLILIDLKEGAELLRYEAVPHVHGGVIMQVKEVERVMAQLETLRSERMKHIRQIAPDIDQFNAQVGPSSRLPRILVVFDEYQGIALDSEARKRIEMLTDMLATKGRAAGIHLMIGTQASYADVVSKLTRSNISITIAGAQPNQGASAATTGSGAAKRLPNIKGRMLCMIGANPIEVQIPHARPQDVTAAIEAAMQYDDPPPIPFADGLDIPQVVDAPKDWTASDVVDIALQHFDGELKAMRIWQEYGKQDGISQRRVQSIVKGLIDHDQIDHGGERYDIKKIRNYFRLEQKPTSD